MMDINRLKANLFNLYSPYPYRDYTRKHKCIFIHIPKSAGTSILNSLTNYPRRDHCTYLNYLQADEKKFNDYYKFTFVRNPWSRMVSLYNYLAKGGNQKKDLNFIKENKSAFTCFESFVGFAEESNLSERYVLFKPQYTFIYDELYQLQVDFLGSFENIDEDFKKVSEHLKVGGNLGSYNKATKGDYRSFYVNDSVIETVSKIYSKDIELLGYNFE